MKSKKFDFDIIVTNPLDIISINSRMAVATCSCGCQKGCSDFKSGVSDGTHDRSNSMY